jgi:predicted AlkP superfamily pyrophosphatase or phosphodiesterase
MLVTAVSAFAAIAAVAAARPPVHSPPVLMVSVDGLKPEYVLEADARGLRIPYLRRLLSEGTYATGVVGVWPTVTYPSHTTLVTGVTPAEHGIISNLEFDPRRNFKESWFWYAAQIRVPTLWQAAHNAGLTTASIGWPVTVGAPDIDFLIPEYWRITAPTEDLNPSDRHLIAALSRPAGLLAALRDSAGTYLMANDITREGDEVKTRYAVEILRRHKPRFTTLHLSSLDAVEHVHGAFSVEANEDLEAIDGMLSRLAAASRAVDAASTVVIVSDHGFTPVTHRVNLFIPFLQAGLIQTAMDPETKAANVTSWRAQPWLAGGMAAIMLRDPADKESEQQAAQLLRTLATDANNGIASILNREQIKERGAFPEAAFLVVFKPGYYTGTSLSGDLVTDIHGTHGGHGFSPEYADMHAALFLTGAGIPHHRDLGVIDMRQIAPTVACLLGISLPSANKGPLPLGSIEARGLTACQRRR